MAKLFIEKYRPRNVNDLILDDTIRKKITQMLNSKNITNLILMGDTGVGKTTTVHCIARTLYSKKYYDNILELNACDDRGIKFVYDTITVFCKTVANYDENGVQHKLLILDEANNLTPKAQKIISFVMEEYKNTKFIFTCNNTVDIIESIQSRCLTIKFHNIPIQQSINKFKFICDSENIKYTEDSLKYLYNKCQEDIRKTINMLEIISKDSNEITIENINEMYNLPSINIIDNLIHNIINKNIRETIVIVNSFKQNGYYPTDILLYIIDHLKNKPFNDILKNENIKIQIIEKLIECSYIMSTSAPSYLHITSYIFKCIEYME